MRGLRERLVGPTAIPRRFRPIFRDLRAGECAVDCGAHVGRITGVLAARGLEVLAFEPNPYAFAVLQQRFADNPRVHCLQQAVSTEDGVAALYLHADSAADPVGRATGSSLLPTKGNVDAEHHLDVPTVDLDRVLRELERPVALLKLDVEGMELPLLRRLVTTGRITAVRHVLVEMHDRASRGGITPEGAAVRALLDDPAYAHVRLDWI